MPGLPTLEPVSRRGRQPEGPSQRLYLGLSRLSAGSGSIQPHAGGPGLAGQPLATTADRGLAGALSGLPARAAALAAHVQPLDPAPAPCCAASGCSTSSATLAVCR